jgi:hypothetical protein
MANIDAFRPLVVARAGGACEYCRLLQDASGVTFHVEHVLPTAADGKTVLGNLALSCPGCNLAKGSRTTAIDSNGVEQKIFNPRNYDPWLLGWHLHFMLDRKSGHIQGLTPVGEATIRLLHMNDFPRRFARKLQVSAGLIG